MHSKLRDHITQLLLPCIGFSALAGFWAALLTTAFKLLAEWVVHISASVYSAARDNPLILPLLLLGAAAIGLISSLILSVSHSCRGGGIPTSVAAICGIFSFKWLATLLLLPISACLTFLAGIPLGTEGPCVQMGTAVGDGVIKCFGGEKNKGWRRYIMTGGASAGFSIATASPVSAIIFAMEEIHKHFSPLLLSVASVSVITAQITSRALASLGIGDQALFDIPLIPSIPHSMFFAPLIIGIASGVVSIFFTRLFYLVDRGMRFVLKKISVNITLPILFALIALVGFFFADALGSGHSLINNILSGGYAPYMLILLFLIRAIGTITSNTSGTTGGIFLPTLAFGALLGALLGDVMISLGWIGSEHYVLTVVIGMTSFLSAGSRIPLTACVFAIEALGGGANVLPLIIGATAALLIVEASGLEDLTDAIIDAKLHKITKGKRSIHIEAPLTVNENSFAVGKELRDVLWPNSCVVVSFVRAAHSDDHSVISPGDVITVHYTTYDPEATTRELCELVGDQKSDIVRIMNPAIV